MERRIARRRRMVLPVKLSPPDGGTILAHTTDVTVEGARIGGLHQQLQPGHLITLRRGSQKARFTVVWVQQVGTGEMQAGLKCVDHVDAFWGVDLNSENDNATNETKMMLELLGQGKSKKGSGSH
jgi:hypothetical protein